MTRAGESNDMREAYTVDGRGVGLNPALSVPGTLVWKLYAWLAVVSLMVGRLEPVSYQQ